MRCQSELGRLNIQITKKLYSSAPDAAVCYERPGSNCYFWSPETCGSRTAHQQSGQRWELVQCDSPVDRSLSSRTWIRCPQRCGDGHHGQRLPPGDHCTCFGIGKDADLAAASSEGGTPNHHALASCRYYRYRASPARILRTGIGACCHWLVVDIISRAGRLSSTSARLPVVSSTRRLRARAASGTRSRLQQQRQCGWCPARTCGRPSRPTQRARATRSRHWTATSAARSL